MAKDKQKQPPSPKPKKAERKRCKSPRGLKMSRVVDKLLTDVDKPHKRHRNDYNHRMAVAAKLAKLL